VGVAIHCARGRLGHRPVRRVSDREVLAALVPERVLPFASGDSRKRGLSRAESKISDAAVGRRKASAPAPFFEVLGKSWASVLPQWEDRREGARRILRCGSWLVRFSALRLPSCLEASLSWRSLFRMRSRFPRERKRLFVIRHPEVAVKRPSKDAAQRLGPSSFEARHSASKTRVNALMARTSG
jgi:hypothetical protein